MAAIDKLYVNSYSEYDDLRRWATVYFPELLFYFYDLTITQTQWETCCEDWVSKQIMASQINFKKLNTYPGYSATENIINHYKVTSNYDCSLEQAKDEVKYIITAYNRTAADWEELYSVPVLNLPINIDKKLRWICPIPFVQKYLTTQCGYKIKWYHKLFWKGKKHLYLK